MKILLAGSGGGGSAISEMAARRSLYDLVEAQIAHGGHRYERNIPKRSTS